MKAWMNALKFKVGSKDSAVATKIISQRCEGYFVSGEEPKLMIVRLSEILVTKSWRKIDKHTDLLFFWKCLK
jgi:hypothetical protein